MSARYRRRRFLVGRFQYTLLGFTLLYLAAIVLTVAAVAATPFLFPAGAGAEAGSESLSVARGVLFLNDRLWPWLLPVVVLIGVHSVLVSHRVAGPLVRLRAVMNGAGEGDLKTRARLRKKDYLWDEAHTLNCMLDGLSAGIERVDARADDLERALARLAEAPPGEAALLARREAEIELERLREAVRFFRTRAPEEAREPPQAAPEPGDRERDPMRRAGFTLIELMIVIAILATLATLGIVVYRRSIMTAREMVAIVELRDLQEAIDLYEMRNEVLPLTLADLELGPQIDPWGSPYQYLNFSTLVPAGGGGNAVAVGGGAAGGGNGGGGGPGTGQKRKDRFIVPINSTYDLYSMGPDGKSVAPLTASASRDDIIRANDGDFIGPVRKY